MANSTGSQGRFGSEQLASQLLDDPRDESAYDDMSLAQVGMKLNEYDSLREQCAKESMGDDWESRLAGMSDEEREAALDGCMDERLGPERAQRLRDYGHDLGEAYGRKRSAVEKQRDAHAGTPYETELQQALDDADAWRTRGMTVDRLRGYGQDAVDHGNVGREGFDPLNDGNLNAAIRRDHGDFDVDAYRRGHSGSRSWAAFSSPAGEPSRPGMGRDGVGLGFASFGGKVGGSSAFEQGIGDAMRRDDEESSLSESVRGGTGSPFRGRDFEGPSL